MVCPHCGSEKEIFIKGKYFCENCGLEKREVKEKQETSKEEVSTIEKEPEKKVESGLSGVFSQMSQQLDIPQGEEKQKGAIDTIKPPFKVKVKKEIDENKENLVEPKGKKSDNQTDKVLIPNEKEKIAAKEEAKNQTEIVKKELKSLNDTPKIQSPVVSKKEVEEPNADVKKEKQEIEKLETAEKVLDVLEHEEPTKIKESPVIGSTEEKPEIKETEKIITESQENLEAEEIKEVSQESAPPEPKEETKVAEDINMKEETPLESVSAENISQVSELEVVPKPKPENQTKLENKPKTKKTRKFKRTKSKSKPKEVKTSLGEEVSFEKPAEEKESEEIKAYSEVFNNDFTKGWLEQDVDTKEIKKSRNKKEKEKEKSFPDNFTGEISDSSPILSSENKDIEISNNLDNNWSEEKIGEEDKVNKNKTIVGKEGKKNEVVTNWFKSFEKELNPKKTKAKSKEKKSHKKILIISLIIFIIILLITGLVLYVNLIVNNPKAALQKAESSLSFPIKKPEYLPPGYDLTTPIIINREKTSVILTYKYLPDESKKIVLTQSQSQWTNQDLYNNYVSINTKEYTQKEQNGKLIYIMDKKKATLINDNLWLLLEINADNITPEELVKVTLSVK